ncbi:MAG: DUF4924 family protein [Bacteroidetes bacterium]|nr:DUF4924 family protein [Bacteroidota bacterium]
MPLKRRNNMTLAQQKYWSGAAEYLLFMWQMEDLLRAVHFDVDALDGFIATYSQSSEEVEAEKKWFQNIVRDMKTERLEQRGHLSELDEIMTELTYLHQSLLKVSKDPDYLSLYQIAKPNMDEYASRAKGIGTNEVELCLQALYGLLVLRLRREKISEETQAAMDSFSALMAALSKEYLKMKQGDQQAALN